MEIMIDGFLHRLLPFQPELALNALRQFQPESYPPMAAFAGLGALLASALLYVIGIWLRRMPAKISTESQQARIETLRGAAKEWLPWLLILSPTPVGGILIIAAGFFAIRPVIAGAMIVLAEIAWRAAPMV